jgi:predicted nucleic acid binding AN1-type Zn finger protein
VPVKKKIKPGRCGMCRKKIGLTGFKCQCEIFFCSAHRMPESHACEFDYKATGRERLASANVAMRAAKVVKI